MSKGVTIPLSQCELLKIEWSNWNSRWNAVWKVGKFQKTCAWMGNIRFCISTLFLLFIIEMWVYAVLPHEIWNICAYWLENVSFLYWKKHRLSSCDVLRESVWVHCGCCAAFDFLRKTLFVFLAVVHAYACTTFSHSS